MTTAEHRINELIKRQRYDGRSMAVILNSVNGYYDYKVCLQISTDETKMLPWVEFWKLDVKKNTGNQKLPVSEENSGKLIKATIQKECLVISSKYNREDPEILIDEAEKIVGKWKCGKQIQKPMEIIT